MPATRTLRRKTSGVRVLAICIIFLLTTQASSSNCGTQTSCEVCIKQESGTVFTPSSLCVWDKMKSTCEVKSFLRFDNECVVQQNKVGRGAEKCESKYDSEKELGKGGGGTVYPVHCENKVFKVSLEEKAGGGENEMTILDHIPQGEKGNRRIVEYFGQFFFQSRQSYGVDKTKGLVFGRYDGNLRSFLKDSIISKQQNALHLCNGPKKKSAFLLQVALQIHEGLKYLHSQGIIHSDIDPSNILFRRHGKACLDFNLAITDFGGAIYVEEGKRQGASGEIIVAVEERPIEVRGQNLPQDRNVRYPLESTDMFQFALTLLYLCREMSDVVSFKMGFVPQGDRCMKELTDTRDESISEYVPHQIHEVLLKTIGTEGADCVNTGGKVMPIWYCKNLGGLYKIDDEDVANILSDSS
eukprot:g1524.t1